MQAASALLRFNTTATNARAAADGGILLQSCVRFYRCGLGL